MSIYSNLHDFNATEEEIRKAEDMTKRDDVHDKMSRRIEDLDEDVIYFTDGKQQKIKPKDLYRVVNNARDVILNDPKMAFVHAVPMFKKDIIFSYDKKNPAWTDGSRIFFNPYWVHIFAKNGMRISKEWEASEEGQKAFKNLSEEDYKSKVNNMVSVHVQFVLLHEVYHVIYDHIKRCYIKCKNPNDKLWDKCNICADLEINRDITAFYPQFGVPSEESPDKDDVIARDIRGVWWRDPRFYDKKGKPFTKAIFETIFDNINDNCVDLINNDDMDHNSEMPEITEENEDELTALQKLYDDGYKYAIDKILNDNIDPMTF